MLAYNALTTLEHTKDYLSIPQQDPSFDSYLFKLINGASSWIESTTGRRFRLKRRKERRPGGGRQKLIVEQYPIRIIHEVYDLDQKARIDPDSYDFDPEHNVGQIYRDKGWPRRGYHTGLVPDMKHEKAYLHIDYSAGYILPKDVTETSNEEWLLPYDLQLLIWEMAGHFVAISQNGATGLSSFSISDVSWSFDKEAKADWLGILETYGRGV